MADRLEILFIGARNGLRSQLAEALLRAAGIEGVEVRSAGLEAGEVHPSLELLLAEVGIEAGPVEAKALAELGDAAFDFVVCIGDRACRACSLAADAPTGGGEAFDRLPLFAGAPIHLFWRVDGPSPGGAQLEAARKVRDVVAEHVDALTRHGYLEGVGRYRRRTRELVDVLDVGIVAHDERRRIYLFNSAAERITGLARAEVLGRDCHRTFAPDGICGSRCSFQSGAPEPFDRSDYQVAFTRADGSDRRLRMLVTPVEVFAGRPAEVFAQLTDVTEIQGLRSKLEVRSSLRGMVGVSPVMREVFEKVRQVAASDYPVLVSGESGTGKELVAHAIHGESRRCGGPFVPINCGALPEHILESELFGHVRGAFTGAIRDKKGRFELADKGTLLLDEVGELSPAFQVRLLRVLQEMRFERVGGERSVSVDVRIVSATNRDLRAMVQEGSFREDLYYRLCVVPIELPPLRERKQDMPLLLEQVLERVRGETGKPSLRVSEAAMARLFAHGWPGNVRELINALQFASVRCPGAEILAEHLPPEVLASSRGAAAGPAPTALEPAMQAEGRRKLDAASVRRALEQTGGNKVRAAKVLGVGRATLYRFLADEPL